MSLTFCPCCKSSHPPGIECLCSAMATVPRGVRYKNRDIDVARYQTHFRRHLDNTVIHQGTEPPRLIKALVRPGCPYCKQFISRVGRLQQPTPCILEVAVLPSAYLSVHEQTHGDFKTVPQIWVDTRYIGGFSDFIDQFGK